MKGRTIWIADAHRGNGKRFSVRVDEKADGLSRTRIGDSNGHVIGQRRFLSWAGDEDSPALHLDGDGPCDGCAASRSALILLRVACGALFVFTFSRLSKLALALYRLMERFDEFVIQFFTRSGQMVNLARIGA